MSSSHESSDFDPTDISGKISDDALGIASRAFNIQEAFELVARSVEQGTKIDTEHLSRLIATFDDNPNERL